MTSYFLTNLFSYNRAEVVGERVVDGVRVGFLLGGIITPLMTLVTGHRGYHRVHVVGLGAAIAGVACLGTSFSRAVYETASTPEDVLAVHAKAIAEKDKGACSVYAWDIADKMMIFGGLPAAGMAAAGLYKGKVPAFPGVDINWPGGRSLSRNLTLFSAGVAGASLASGFGFLATFVPCWLSNYNKNLREEKEKKSPK
jgi:hypothetical protein